MQALRLAAEPAGNDKLLALVELAGRDVTLAALVAVVRERPSYLTTINCQVDPQLLAVLQKLDIEWPEFAELLPRLVAAAEHIHQFGIAEFARNQPPL
jgi:hypothetical protein